MDKKKILLIAGGALLALVVLIVGLSFIGRPAPEENTNGSPASINDDLTDAEKATIESKTQEFLASMGNYGWYPDLIKNPASAGGEPTDEFFYSQEYTSAEDLQVALRKLTNSDKFDSSINGDAYNAPFSVESTFTGDITVPNRAVAEGNQTFVIVNVPIQSQLSYISTNMGFYDENMNWIEPVTNVKVATFEGELEVRFVKTAGNWYVGGFSSTVGVLGTDNFFIANGDLIVDATPTSLEEFPVK